MAARYNFCNAACQIFRLTTVFFVVFNVCQHALKRLPIVVVGQGNGRNASVGGESRTKIAGLHYRNIDAELCRLEAQGFAVTFDGKFRCAVQSLVRYAKASADGTDVDDVPAALSAHVWQYAATHVDHASEIGLHLQTYLVVGGQFGSAAYTNAGVVYHHIDASIGVDDVRNAGCYRSAARYVHLQYMAVVGVGGVPACAEYDVPLAR